MYIEKEGVKFALANFKEDNFQTLTFTHKEGGEYVSGTTNEEVINALVDRFYFLQKKNPSNENTIIIDNLKNVRRLMKQRLSKKIDRVKELTNEQYGNEGNQIKQ